jgi:hypothetical protein
MTDFLPVPAMKLHLADCLAFVDRLRREGLSINNLAALRDASATALCRAMSAHLAGATESTCWSYLNDPELGIFVLDIPEGIDPDPCRDATMAATIAVSLMGRFFEPAIDPANGTPFTVYNASPENERRLSKAGLGYFSPDEKLGFHTDGMIDGSMDGMKVRVPRFIGVYNLLINYQRPGNFHWIPFALWHALPSFAERFGWNVPYEVELTPSVYEKSGVDRAEPRRVNVPIFSGSEREPILFYNGSLTGEQAASGEALAPLAACMRQSISSNPLRYSIPQRQRRLVVARNDRGFHARDVFEKPYSNCKYTRSLLRSISRSGPVVASC